MPRIVSVWLPRWPILRLLAAQARNILLRVIRIDPQRPFVLAVEASGGPRIAALNAAAEELGLHGRRSAGRCPRQGRKRCRCAALDPAADDAALRRLALWATRYTPAVSPWGEENGADGFFLEVTGAAHLFGGEERLLADLAQPARSFRPAGAARRRRYRGRRLGTVALSSVAGHRPAFRAGSRGAGAAADRGAAASRPTPAPRCAGSASSASAPCIDKPRAPFAARFEKRAAQPPRSGARPRRRAARLHRAAAGLSQPALSARADRHAGGDRRDHGPPDEGSRATRSCATASARARCGLRSTASTARCATLDIGLTLPTRDAAHVARLLDLKLERIAETVDAGFGFEALGLAVTPAERMEPAERACCTFSDDRP